jgi:hypothetical protein
MTSLDVLDALLQNPNSNVPSMGELVEIPPIDITDSKDLEALYENTNDPNQQYGTGMTLDDLATSVQDQEFDSAEQGAIMQFKKLEAIVESVAAMEAQKRHALVCGDPG